MRNSSTTPSGAHASGTQPLAQTPHRLMVRRGDHGAAAVKRRQKVSGAATISCS